MEVELERDGGGVGEGEEEEEAGEESKEGEGSGEGGTPVYGTPAFCTLWHPRGRLPSDSLPSPPPPPTPPPPYASGDSAESRWKSLARPPGGASGPPGPSKKRLGVKSQARGRGRGAALMSRKKLAAGRLGLTD